MKEELLLAAEKLKKQVDEAKSMGTFDLVKLTSNDFSPLVVGDKVIKRVSLGTWKEFYKIIDLYKNNQEFVAVLWHFRNIQDLLQLESENKKKLKKIDLRPVLMPKVLEDEDNKKSLDHINQMDIFNWMSLNKSDHKTFKNLNKYKKKLSTKQQEVLTLFLDNKTLADISKELNISRAAVTKMFKRIVFKLKKLVGNVNN